MKLLRFGPSGSEKPGLLGVDGSIRDLSAHINDIDASALNAETLARLAAIEPGALPVVGGRPRIGACVAGVEKMVCIGLNYSDHAAEAGMDVPTEPIIFMKASSAICGPDDDIECPRGADTLDWEVELGVVIGTRAKYVKQVDALSHVAGYCVVNDVSERDFQLRRLGQWTKGKSHDTFGPIGPTLVTADEVPDPQNLTLSTRVNGADKQDGTTRTMVFAVDKLISYLSHFMTLNPGDIIATGTPPGVGMGATPPVYLKAGDTVELSVEGLGTQSHRIVPA